MNRDFMAAGFGNVAVGHLPGPAGGRQRRADGAELAAGARSRWAPIFAGLWMLVILVLFSGRSAGCRSPRSRAS